MKRSIERQMLRLLHGELPAHEAGELRRLLKRQPDLAKRFDQLTETWQKLELAPPQADPPGFEKRLLEAVAARRFKGLSWSLAPVWARAGGALALAIGLAVGVSFAPEQVNSTTTFDTAELDLSVPATLAESYWLTLEDGGGWWPDTEDAL